MCSRWSRSRIANPPTTMIPSASDHPRRHRPPPELERIRPLRAEQEEAEDEAEVRGVEDVTPAERDQVLREQRHRGGAGEDPPAVHAPPVAVLGSGHAQDEGDAVPRQERARGPQDHPLAPERDADLEHRARDERDEDLCDREPELERDLPEHLQRDDHRREVQARVPQRRKQDRVGRASNAKRRPARVDGGHANHLENPTQVSTRPGTSGWSQPGSNRRPPRCQRGALPAELWPHGKPSV